MRSVVQLLLVVLALFALAQARHTRWHELDGYTFERYVQEYHKIYTKSEYALREQIFYEKLDVIQKHNADASQTYKKGVNHLTDLTPQEFKKMLGYKKFSRNTERVESTADIDMSFDYPPQLDWRDANIITAVKNQGQCGSCWAFSAVESVESYTALATNQLQDLSIQEILDCTTNPNQCGGTGGCGGATYELAWQTVMTLGGLASEWTYPYQSYQGNNFDSCNYNATLQPPQTQLSNFVDLPGNQYDAVVQALAQKGPLSISVDASSWSDYETGIYNGCNQSYPDIDHAVQLVGYGFEHNSNHEFWIVRNSWAPTWGEDGYIRLYKSSELNCGTDITPSDGSGCLNGPPNVTVCGTCGLLYEPAYPVITVSKH
jgi:cathepsin L